MLSVVIITCNRKSELRRAIISCIEHGVPGMEFVVVDNGSKDGTDSMVKNLSSSYGFTLKYLYQEKNIGVSEGRNIGFKNAGGDIVYFLDDDAYVVGSRDCIEKVYRFMDSNTNIAIIATEIYNVRDKVWQYSVFPKGVPFRTDGETLCFIGASHFIRKSAFKDKDLYPADLFYGGEEYYAALSAWGKDMIIWYSREMSVIHNPSPITRLSDYEIRRNIYINIFIVKRLIVPVCLIIIIWLFFLLRLVKFCRLNIKRWRECMNIYNKRFDKQYRRPISLRKILFLGRNYGWKTIL